MSIDQGTTDFTLSVEFAGLCLYVVDRRREPTVSVLLPTCVATPDGRVNTRHEDGDVGARHVPYLLMDLANLGQTVEPGLAGDGPRFQVVRRLNREELVFGPEESTGSAIQLEPEVLPLPDLSVYKDRISLNDVLSEIAPNERPELTARTRLNAGTLTATTVDGSGKGGVRPGQNQDWDRDPADWAGSIKWTRKIRGNSLTIGIRSWDTGQTTSLTLTPIKRNGGSVIELKVANLCETNPLEWKEFESSFHKDDVDFKWLYRLFGARDPRHSGSVLKAIGRDKLPYPKLTPRGARSTGSTGCTGGQFGLP